MKKNEYIETFNKGNNIFSNAKKKKTNTNNDIIKILKSYYPYNIENFHKDNMFYLKFLFLFEKFLEKEKNKQKIVDFYNGILYFLLDKIRINLNKLNKLKKQKNLKEIRLILQEIKIIEKNLIEYLHLISILQINDINSKLRIKDLQKKLLINSEDIKNIIINNNIYNEAILKELLNKINNKIIFIEDKILKINLKTSINEEEYKNKLNSLLKIFDDMNKYINKILEKDENEAPIKEILTSLNKLNGFAEKLKQEEQAPNLSLQPTATYRPSI